MLLLVHIFLFFIHFASGCDPDFNFVERIDSGGGEVVVRVRYGNNTAVQTSYSGFYLIELTDQKTLIQMWFEGTELVECVSETKVTAVQNFLQEFCSSSCFDSCCLSRGNNTSCPAVQKRMTQVIVRDEKLPPDVELLVTRNTILLQKCSQFQQQQQNEQKQRNNNRVKRDILFPGTKWCGAGFSGKTFTELGVHVAADRCCRDHDHCKHYISPFSWKYSLFNYRFHTVSHCRCDQRFRSCLKRANTPTANMIGKLFFNIGKTKCFTFRRERMCKKRSWWGTCIKQGKVRKALFKNVSPY